MGSPKSGGRMSGKPALGIGDMKDMMRASLMNVKTYEAGVTNPDGGFGHSKSTTSTVARKSTKLDTLG